MKKAVRLRPEAAAQIGFLEWSEARERVLQALSFLPAVAGWPTHPRPLFDMPTCMNSSPAEERDISNRIDQTRWQRG
ncbi:MAG: hypothetical protein DMG41_29860 [Acidobacteria bacterium]|nr:MAG: hypothetical protein AUH01_00670 [Acidobacteria bacterium 13_2_20CM_56_17]PYT74935.1 MAG: hypothetical protein DMG42_09865 [Acidobacteriota bacterium]PYT83823.1 MAG: hypothetical protein DMG41_29860 [Acidobacteriota bacterium]